MRIGVHVSIAGGLWNAPINAAKVGAEVFQIFSRSPHGGPIVPITSEVQKKFKSEMAKNHFDTFYIHTPYFINLASIKNNIYYGSISVIRQELEKGSILGARAVMTHLGSFGDQPEKDGLEKVITGLEKVLKGYNGETKLLLEMSAGAGKIVGDTFEEIAEIIFDKRLKRFNLGVCFDTCHAFASGYDLRSETDVARTFKDFNRIIGLDKLSLIHCNDSKAGLGKHLDRHEHIGEGFIGINGFKALVKYKHLSKLDWILETPKDDPRNDKKNIEMLRKLTIS